MDETHLNALVEELAGRDCKRIAQVQKELVAAGEAVRQAVLHGMSHDDSRVRRARATSITAVTTAAS